MNRRQLLHTLSVLTASGAWTALSENPVAAACGIVLPRQDSPLMAAIAEARTSCDWILNRSQTVSRAGVAGTTCHFNRLSALIDEAQGRAAVRCHDCPAFWQACSDAFLRAVEQLSDLTTADHISQADVSQAKWSTAEAVFRRTAQLLTEETVRAAGSHT